MPAGRMARPARGGRRAARRSRRPGPSQPTSRRFQLIARRNPDRLTSLHCAWPGLVFRCGASRHGRSRKHIQTILSPQLPAVFCRHARCQCAGSAGRLAVRPGGISGDAPASCVVRGRCYYLRSRAPGAGRRSAGRLCDGRHCGLDAQPTDSPAGAGRRLQPGPRGLAWLHRRSARYRQ